jgi:hypothetical protein
MKGKSWAPWLLAGLLALGPIPAAASDTAVAVPQAAYALTRETAQKEVHGLQAIRLASRRAQDAFDEWQNSIGRAKDIDPEKRTFMNPWTGMTVTIRFDDKTQLRLRMQKYLLPDQMKLSWQMASKSLDVTLASLENTMDSLLLGLVASQNDLKAKVRSRTLSSDTLSRAKASRAAGNLTQLDVDAAALDLEKADMAVTASERAFENQCCNYNRFVGAPLSRKLTVSMGVSSIVLYLSAEEYAVQAIRNRMELFSLREGIPLKERTLEMLAYKDMNKIDADIATEYAGAELDLERARLDLADNERSIRSQILAAFISLESARLDLKIAEQSLQRQKDKLEAMKKQIAAGRVPAWSDDAMVNAIAGMEEGLSLSRLSLGVKVRRFRQAAQTGPAYSGY